MYFKRVFTSSIAHYSYIIGEDKDMVVIDPQPDIDKYLEISRSEGMKIKAILETHRNEDFVVGSRALSELTGAKVYIAADEDLDYEYGTRISDGTEIEIGTMKLKAIHTPGHTLAHMSYALYLKSESPYMVFTGDMLFFGGVGRTDFYGKDRLEEMTGHLYDSILKKILILGDDVLLFPAHGAGSACGANIDNRPYSTLGYERKFNPNLKYSTKEDFIDGVAKMLYKPHYFEDMERINLKGIDAIDCNLDLRVKYTEEVKESGRLVDIRNQRAFIGEHIEGSLFVVYVGLTAHLNWFVSTDEDILFITDNQEKDYLNNLYLDMRRIGYKGKLSFLAGGIEAWNKEARVVIKSKYISPKEIKDKIHELIILDVRGESEFEDIKPIEGSIKIPMEEIKDRYEELPKGKTICIVCATGKRALTVSSFLEQKNIDTSILLGGIRAWKNLD